MPSSEKSQTRLISLKGRVFLAQRTPSFTKVALHSLVINKKLAPAAECSGRGVVKLKFQGDEAAATEFRRPANNMKLSRIDSTLKRASRYLSRSRESQQ